MGEIDLRIEGLRVEPEGDDDPADRALAVREAQLLAGPVTYGCSASIAFFAARARRGGLRSPDAGGAGGDGFSDRPYNVRIEGNVSGLGAIQTPIPMARGEMDEAEFTAFLVKACSLLASHSAAGSLHFIFIDWRHMGELLAAGRQVYTELKNLCVWVKTTPEWEPSIGAAMS